MDISDKQRKLPVLVFIHGGKYQTGSNNSTQYAPDYLVEQDVVLVTVNYRLDIFGEKNISNVNFLSFIVINVRVHIVNLNIEKEDYKCKK
jgi:carboxylesterase type B